jgi:hypothetical protein
MTAQANFTSSKLRILQKCYDRSSANLHRLNLARNTFSVLLRKQTTAKNGWIAKRLNMGHPSRVSNLIQNKA